MTETPNGPHDPQQNDPSSSPRPGRPPYAGPEWRRADAPATPPADAAEHGPVAGSAENGPFGGPAENSAAATEDGLGGRAPQYGAAGEGASQYGPVGQGAPQSGAAGDAAPQFGAAGEGEPQYGAAGEGAFQYGRAGEGAPRYGAAGEGAPQYGPAGQGGPHFGPTGEGVSRFGAAGEARENPGFGGSAPDFRPAGPYAGAPYGGPHYAPQYGATTAATGPYAAPRNSRGKRLIAIGAATAVFGGLVGGGTVAVLDRGNDTVAASGITIQGSSAPAATNQTASVESAAATAMKSVVTLSVRGSQEAGTGSGIVLRADGYILTNEHVVAVADRGGSITVAFSDGRTATATLVGADKATDLAVVKVNLTGLTAATFADSGALKVGQTVVAVGSPLGLNGTVTEGIVSALHRPTSGASDNSAVIDAIQTDAAINPGNSGGALVDLAGRVVGINQSIATAGSGGGGFGQQSSASGNIGIGFAIPSDTAARVAQQLISTGKATHAQLGVETQTATSADQLTAIGATIAKVTPGSAADKAGIKAGDVVIKVDDRVIGQSDDLAATVRSYAPGTKVTLTIRRGSATQTITVTLGSDTSQ